MSNSLEALISSVQSAKSSQDVDIIMETELFFLKKSLSESGIGIKNLKDLLLRVAYCSLFGQDVEFAFMKCTEVF